MAGLQPEVGKRGRISGLAARSDLNGKLGDVIRWIPNKDRWAIVVVGSNERVLVRKDCIDFDYTDGNAPTPSLEGYTDAGPAMPVNQFKEALQAQGFVERPSASPSATLAPAGKAAPAPDGMPSRMTPAVEEVSALPKLRLKTPPRSCVDELRRPDLLPHVPAMADLLEDVSFKVQQLMYETLPVELPPDELFAVVSYTYDNQTGAQAGNLYFELNRALRQRDAVQRTAALQLWGGYLYYLLSGLSKLTDVETVVYRGYPDKAKVVEQYKVGRPIQWGAFSSTSMSVAATKNFTDQEHGVIFKLTVLSGKVIRAYSYFPSEDEVLLSPQGAGAVRRQLKAVRRGGWLHLSGLGRIGGHALHLVACPQVRASDRVIESKQQE